MNGPKFRVLFSLPHRPKLVTLAFDLSTAWLLAKGLRHVGADIILDERALRRGDGQAFDLKLQAAKPCGGGACSMTLLVCYAPSPQAVLTPAEIEVLVPQKVMFAGLWVTPIGSVTIEVPRREPRSQSEFAEWMESQLADLVSRGRPRDRSKQ